MPGLSLREHRRGRWYGRRGEPPFVHVQRHDGGVVLVLRDRDAASALRACERALVVAGELEDAAATEAAPFIAAELERAERRLAGARAAHKALLTEHGDVAARLAAISERLAALRDQRARPDASRQGRIDAEIAGLQDQALALHPLRFEAERHARAVAAAELERRALLERVRRAGAGGIEVVRACAIRACPR